MKHPVLDYTKTFEPSLRVRRNQNNSWVLHTYISANKQIAKKYLRMKTIVIFTLFAFLTLCGFKIYSQESCKVLKQKISEKYSGKCKNGLAHGKGIAVGKDKYEGGFRNGLPQGDGKYTWANGEVFEGRWKNGQRNGEGKFFYKKYDVDIVKVGLWQNDVFVKHIKPSPFKVLRSYSITRYSVRRIKDGNRVLFHFKQTGGGNNATISGILFTPSSGDSYILGSSEGFENVIFPFTCKVIYQTSNTLNTVRYDAEFVVEIREFGEWEILLYN